MEAVKRVEGLGWASHLLGLQHRRAGMPFSHFQGPAGLDGLDGKDGKPGVRVRWWAQEGTPFLLPPSPRAKVKGTLMKGIEFHCPTPLAGGAPPSLGLPLTAPHFSNGTRAPRFLCSPSCLNQVG